MSAAMVTAPSPPPDPTIREVVASDSGRGDALPLPDWAGGEATAFGDGGGGGGVLPSARSGGRGEEGSLLLSIRQWWQGWSRMSVPRVLSSGSSPSKRQRHVLDVHVHVFMCSLIWSGCRGAPRCIEPIFYLDS